MRQGLVECQAGVASQAGYKNRHFNYYHASVIDLLDIVFVALRFGAVLKFSR